MGAKITTTKSIAMPTNRPALTTAANPAPSLLEHVDAIRLKANTKLDDQRRKALGQFMTPLPVAQLMASMFTNLSDELHILDAGAGVGSLTAAVIEETFSRPLKPSAITAHAYELDTALINPLKQSMQRCKQVCGAHNSDFIAHIRQDDFVNQATTMLQGDLFSKRLHPRFNRAILNPPYFKINSDSITRRQLSGVGIETVNIYAAFVALAIKLLEAGGELVAITPRSFCNGPYFKPFRQLLFSEMRLNAIHIFDSRNKAFKGDDVLQENIIIHAIKEKSRGRITIASSACAEDKDIQVRQAQSHEVIGPHDPELFIHITKTEAEGVIASTARNLPCSLDDLDIKVSTGRVVDFRAKQHLVMEPRRKTVPLIYPTHFKNGFIAWPKTNCRKPNALVDCPETDNLMVPSGVYTLCKRFSSKEERRRVVAAVFDPKLITAHRIGFENHLNYFHRNGHGLPMGLSKGLALFLNSSLVDNYFRQFNGHTQVNATDLRSLRYPTVKQLVLLGNRFKTKLPVQEKIDQLIDEIILCDIQSMTKASAR